MRLDLLRKLCFAFDLGLKFYFFGRVDGVGWWLEKVKLVGKSLDPQMKSNLNLSVGCLGGWVGGWVVGDLEIKANFSSSCS